MSWTVLCKAVNYACSVIDCSTLNIEPEYLWCTMSVNSAARDILIGIIFPIADKIFNSYEKAKHSCSRTAGTETMVIPSELPRKTCRARSDVSNSILCKAFTYACSRIDCNEFSSCTMTNADIAFSKYYSELNACSTSAGKLGYVSMFKRVERDIE